MEEEAKIKEAPQKGLRQRKTSLADSLDLEAGKVFITASHSSKGWKTTLFLAFQSIGIVYGDIGTSPMYVFSSIFVDGIHNTDDILGVLSLMIYTIVALPMLKYVFIVLHANDNGNGGAFALYSLICRHAKVSLIPNQQPEDMQLSNYTLETPSKLKGIKNLKQKLENSYFARVMLILITMLGTSMVIGDGIFTPAMSVLSAVSGISTSLGEGAVLGITIVILIFLFYMQRFGTDKVGLSFAPILVVWFALISGIGLYNLIKHDTVALRAFNPKCIYDYFKRNGFKKGWLSLSGIFLCITGSEAMFADLGHFSVKAIQISFSFVTFPAILIAYIGQAAFLRKFPEQVSNTFYACIPEHLYWPTFVIAVLASIIASQAMISGAFSIISQAQTLGCFPRVKIVHTSTKHRGQVYIPEINFMFMIACIVVSVAFKTSANMSNAYGIAVVCDMIITSFLVAFIILVIWKKSIWLVALFLPFGCIELLYLSSQMTKFTKGGFVPLVLAFFLTALMGIWHYVQKERYMFELNNKVSAESLAKLVTKPNINRIPGIGLLYSELVQGIPPIFPHFIANIPAIHSVFLFVSIKAIPIATVASEERFLFHHMEPRDHRIFRCVVRLGYKDELGDHVEFESQLVQHLKEFITQTQEIIMHETEAARNVEQAPISPTIKNEVAQISQGYPINDTLDEEGKYRTSSKSSDSITLSGVAKSSTFSSSHVNRVEKEIEFIEKAMEKGVVYLLGEAEVVADPKSFIFNKIVVNYAYSFLRKNFRQRDKMMAIPRNRLVKVGMTYEI